MAVHQTQKLWTAGGVVAVALIALLGWLMFISPANSQTSAANAQKNTVQLQNDALQARLNALAVQNKHLATFEAALTQAHAALPSSDGLANFLRELQTLGNSTLVKVTNVSVSNPLPATGNAAATPTTGATTPTGIYEIPITVQASGSEQYLNQFLNQLQEVQPRAVLITQASLGAGTQSTNVATGQNTLQLTMNAFVDPAN